LNNANNNSNGFSIGTNIQLIPTVELFVSNAPGIPAGDYFLVSNTGVNLISNTGVYLISNN